MTDLETSPIFARLEDLAKEDATVAALVVNVRKAVGDCVDLTKAIVTYLPEYTLHDETHVFGVLERMGCLLPASVLARLRPLELAGLILSAALHDVGMCPERNEFQRLTGQLGEDDPGAQAYAASKAGYLTLTRRQSELRDEQRFREADQIESFLLSSYLRRSHGERTRRWILGKFRSHLKYADYDFAPALAEVCRSHTEDVSVLSGISCWELVRAPGEYCNWRFVAVVLRLADILDFDPKRTPALLFEHLGVRDPISVSEWHKHRAITAWDIRPGRVAFAARCRDPVIEKCIRTFIGSIEGELLGAIGVVSGMHDAAEPQLSNSYDLQLPSVVDKAGIKSEETIGGPLYRYVDAAFQLDTDAIMSLMFGISLYANPLLFLRELLQNAADACRHRVAMASSEGADYKPRVQVLLHEAGTRQFITVKDNGTGMNDDIVQRYFARVGQSYYTSDEFLEQRSKLGLDFRPVSKFGIGVLSVFMAGDLLQVETLSVQQGSTALSIEIAGQGSLFWFRKGSRSSAGTDIRLRLNGPLQELILGDESPPSLYELVADLAPHLEFAIGVHDLPGNPAKTVRSNWQLPQLVGGRPEVCAIRLDLTNDAPAGIDGVVDVFLLSFDGNFRDEVHLQDDVEDFLDDAVEPDDDHDYIARLKHQFGYIHRIHPDYSAKQGYFEAFSVEVESRGRWSQQGFAVSSPLFPAGDVFGSIRGRPIVPFPFPVHYDLNLSGDFALPLSLDRNSVVLVEEAYATGERISRCLVRLLFGALSDQQFALNRKFFEQIGTSVSSQILLDALDEPRI